MWKVINEFLVSVDDFVWGIPLMVLILAGGILLTTRLGLLQMRRLPLALKWMFKNEEEGDGEISSFAALCTALSATIGTGNIVGVATAVCAGGPGALFWMLVAAFFGMATKYAEGLLAVKYRVVAEDGHSLGGPFYYIERGMGSSWKWLAKIFAFFGVCVGLFGIGTFSQVNGISSAVQNFFDPDKAKEILAEAGYPDGEGFPTITYKYPSLQLDSDMAQALQAQWKTNLGVEVELQAEEQQVQVAERRSGDFQLARMRWTADFTDPFTFLSMYRSNDSYNDNKTNCPEYDELMAQSNQESDPTARFELLHQAENVLVNDYCFGVPVLNSSNIYLVSTDITNFEIDPSRNMIRTKYLVLGDSASES